MTEPCMPCVCALHWECRQPKLEVDVITCCCPEEEINTGREVEEKRGRGRPMADLEDVTDPISTGRKRAAMLYPIFDGMVCEWSGLMYAGGGVIPIVGCQGNLIYEGKGSDRGDRHHGPDKSTLNNGPGNLHRICQQCHKRHHELNDPFYGPRPDPKEQYLPLAEHGTCWPHDPVTVADATAVAITEEWWEITVAKRPPYPYTKETLTIGEEDDI